MPSQEISFGATKNELNTKEKMVRGSLWMTIGNVFSRLLGAAYVIPWYAWMGEDAKIANALFNKGYNIYALFLMIATAGIPGAIAKQISHYNSLNEYGISRRLFRRTMIIMGAFGVACAGVMYLLAPVLADGNSDLIPVMRALSVAILIFPMMSVIRGYFQGNQNMMPSAVSQIIEQIARVFYMLLMTFIIMKVMSGNYVEAVIQSTFAAFIGMLGAFAVLIWFYQKQKSYMNRLVANSANEVTISENSLIKEMIKQAIPFIIVGSAITLFKLVDQYTFERMMANFTNYSPKQLEALFSVFSANPDKLVMITVSLATGMAMTSLPLVTEAYTKNEKGALATLVSNNIQLLLLIMVPATLGMIVLARPMYVLFYSPDVLGVRVLIEASLVGLVMGYFILISTTLQGLYRNREAILFLGVGLAFKIVLQYPMIRMFETYGPLISTAIGLGVSALLMTHAIYRMTKFDLVMTARRILLIFILGIVMSLITWLVRNGLYNVFNPDRKFQAFMIIMICVAIGVISYGWLVLRVRLADQLLGRKARKFRRKFKIR